MTLNVLLFKINGKKYVIMYKCIENVQELYPKATVQCKNYFAIDQQLPLLDYIASEVTLLPYKSTCVSHLSEASYFSSKMF